MTYSNDYELKVTTQGPTYPPSEIMNKDGNFVVIGTLNIYDEINGLKQEWGSAIVSPESEVPIFGKNVPYKIIKRFDWKNISKKDDCELYTLPLPLPCNNYSMIFAPEQKPWTNKQRSFPLHLAPIPDLRSYDGRKRTDPIKLSDWVKAKGSLNVCLNSTHSAARFEFNFSNLIPDSLYTLMALREHDLNPHAITRPGPLGVPNVLITDKEGNGNYLVNMPNPFPCAEQGNHNRIISVVLLWMSTQMSYGGAIGHFGLGGDIHAQLKLPGINFLEFTTYGE